MKILIQSIYFISYSKSYNQFLTKDKTQNLKTFQRPQRPAFQFKDFQGFQRPLRTLYNTDQIHVYIRKMRTDLLFSSNTPTRGDYLGYKSIKIESILSIKIDKYR